MNLENLIKTTQELRSKLKIELEKERHRLMEKYWFHIVKDKIVFYEKVREYNRKFKENVFKYIFTIKMRHFLSLPFIYSMIIPTLLLDIFISIYQFFAFPLYWIPKVSRRDYIIYDRKLLDYLNIIQKAHCCYCSYVNWIFAYAVEIAWRTEKYWCPIKNVNNRHLYHNLYDDFADYWDPKWFKDKMNKYFN